MWWKKKKKKVYEVVVVDKDDNLIHTRGYYSTMERAKARVDYDLNPPMPGTKRRSVCEFKTCYRMPYKHYYEDALLYGVEEWTDNDLGSGIAFQWLIVEHMMDALI